MAEVNQKYIINKHFGKEAICFHLTQQILLELAMLLLFNEQFITLSQVIYYKL